MPKLFLSRTCLVAYSAILLCIMPARHHHRDDRDRQHEIRPTSDQVNNEIRSADRVNSMESHRSRFTSSTIHDELQRESSSLNDVNGYIPGYTDLSIMTAQDQFENFEHPSMDSFVQDAQIILEGPPTMRAERSDIVHYQTDFGSLSLDERRMGWPQETDYSNAHGRYPEFVT